MAFRVLNIGDGAGIIPSAATKVIYDDTYSRTGQAFTGVSPSGSSDSYWLFTLNDYIGTDIWIKFNLYINSTSSVSNFYLGYWNNDSAYESKNFSWLEGLCLSDGYLKLVMVSTTNVYALLKKKEINDVWCHIHNEVGTDASYGELNVNGVLTSKSVTRSSSAYAIGTQVPALKTMVIRFGRKDVFYVSNLIISDKEISPKEQVIALPIGSTSTNMTVAENGTYIANREGQMLLQTPDVADLSQKYGAGSQVTGVAVVGNPAYNMTTLGVGDLIGISKAEGSKTEHDSISLGTDSTAVIQDAWSVSNMTIADLANMQFGWQVGM